MAPMATPPARIPLRCLSTRCLLAATSVIGIVGVPPASATPAQPPTDGSWYMNTTSTSTAYNLGCNHGKYDASTGHSSEDVLDFGRQLGNGSGTLEIGNQFTFSNSQINSIVVAFAQGYYVCTGSDTSTIDTIGVGTNNSYQDVSYSGGQAWGQLVNSIASTVSSDGYSSQVIIEGASDIEPGFSSPSAAISWAQGYASVTSNLYINYGSAGGCLTNSNNNGGCNNGWNQYDVWYVSWGSPPAVAAPEIYHQANANQWQEISLYGNQYQSGPVYYQGPWDEYPLNTSTFTNAQAWAAFENALDANAATAQTMPYSLEVHDE
jgi:hypothetical protein